MTENLSESNRDLIILEHIEVNPDATQASLASQLGVAVGTINWHIKRLVAKGYVKVRRAERRKLRYIITPEGLALRANLTVNYIQTSFSLFRLIRERSQDTVEQLQQMGYVKACIIGNGDVAEVCRLTCLELGIEIVENQNNVPKIKIEGLKIFIEDGEEK